MIERTIATKITQANQQFPVIVLTGPRQSGKTTLLQQLFPNHQYLSLESPDVRQAANNDPRGFIRYYSSPVIFDEIQYTPELLFYIKEQVDQQRQQAGQYLLTGSQNLLLLQQVTETLVGRAAILTLLPLSQREIQHQPMRLFPWEINHLPEKETDSSSPLWPNFLRGNYPEIVAHPKYDADLWYASYIQTYLERDIRNLRQIGDLTQFQTFLRLLAARSAQLLNMTELARDLGLATNTIKIWISLLEASYQIIILRPYFTNLNKRLVKMPKIYFTDVGVLCYLVGLHDPLHAASGPMAGAIMETAVFSELLKGYLHRGLTPRLYFWRTASGDEVDFIVEHENKLVPIEVKTTATPLPKMAAGINKFREGLEKKTLRGYLIHAGDRPLPLGSNVLALPFTDL